jgi:hypothetical protein
MRKPRLSRVDLVAFLLFCIILLLLHQRPLNPRLSRLLEVGENPFLVVNRHSWPPLFLW